MILPPYTPVLRDVANSAFAISSASGGSNPASLAFDRLDGTEWQTAGVGSTSDYIGQDFTAATPKKVRRVRLLQNGSATFSVNSISIQYSDDIVGWTTIAAGNSAVVPGNNIVVVADNGSHRGWRVKANAATGGGAWIVPTVEFHINA